MFGWAYIRNNIFVGKWMGLYPGGLKPGGDLKVGFYGSYTKSIVTPRNDTGSKKLLHFMRYF